MQIDAPSVKQSAVQTDTTSVKLAAVQIDTPFLVQSAAVQTDAPVRKQPTGAPRLGGETPKKEGTVSERVSVIEQNADKFNAPGGHRGPGSRTC